VVLALADSGEWLRLGVVVAMPPKKGKEAVPEKVVSTEPEVPEESEEGPGKATFEFTVSKIANLPSELETVVELSGPVRTLRSSPGPAATEAGTGYEASGWEWEKSRSIRLIEQSLWDDIVGRPLTISVFDSKAEDPETSLVGKAVLDLSPLLHNQIEVGGDVILELTDTFKALWTGDGSQNASAVPMPGVLVANTGVTSTPSPDVPKTTISVNVSVNELLGPEEDRTDWVIVKLGVNGVFSLPPRLTELGVTGPEDIDQHQMAYKARFLGEELKSGALVAPPEKAPVPPEPAEGDDAEEKPPEENELDKEEDSEEKKKERRADKERFDFSVRFTDNKLARYRGSEFIKQFQEMLNHVGGVWFYFLPEEKPSTDPKKQNPPEIPQLAEQFSGRAWLGLTNLIYPGVRSVEAVVEIESMKCSEGTEELVLESSDSFVRLTLELNRDMAATEPPEAKIPLPQLLTSHQGLNKFPSSIEAANLYTSAVQRGFETILQDCSTGCGEVPEVVEELRKRGHYDDMKQDLRSAMIQIVRERLRKDPNMVPGKPLADTSREEFFSDTYAYLKAAMIEVLDNLQKETTIVGAAGPGDGNVGDSTTRKSTIDSAGAVDSTTARKSTVESADGVSARKLTVENAPGESTVVSAASRKIPADTASGEPENSVGEVDIGDALRESAAARQARETLGSIADARERNGRLVYETEMVGNWSRAANLFHNRLLLADCCRDPQIWIEYAMFCMRARGRQASAEEALRQAVQLLAEDVPVPDALAVELDLMLACLLLDRGRHDEALSVFRERHRRDMSDPFALFLLALCLFLSGEDEPEWKPYFQAVLKPRDWFQGLPDDTALFDKLRMFALETAPDVSQFVACLEKLLDFGLPTLVFTFLDQCDVLSQASLADEEIALVDAKAAMLERNWVAAAASLEPIIGKKGKSASPDAWRLSGEVHFQLQDFEKALHELQYYCTLSMEKRSDDPAAYIRFGSVLLLKKRWPKAKDAYLRSIHCRPTAEAWSGVARAAYQSQELRECYEALREANLLDNERSDVWAQLCLVNLRFESTELANHCFKQCVKFEPDSDELLLDIANECIRRDTLPEVAETAARLALQIRDTFQSHSALAEAFAKRGEAEKAILEAQIAIRLSLDQGDQRKFIFEKALKWAEDLGDPALRESLHAVHRLAEQQEAERVPPPSP
jgi:tetratricopeptide (TPR) repeat protein